MYLKLFRAHQCGGSPKHPILTVYKVNRVSQRVVAALKILFTGKVEGFRTDSLHINNHSNVFKSLNRPAASLMRENSMQNACTSINKS